MATLTAAQKSAVTNNWAKVQPAWRQTIGPDFVIRLFEKHPKVKAYFKMFDGMDSAAIRSSNMIRAHVCHFQHALASFVENLDDLDCLILLLDKLAVNHHARGINPALFLDAFAVLMAVIKEKTGADDATIAAWDAVLKVVGKVLADKMNAM